MNTTLPICISCGSDSLRLIGKLPFSNRFAGRKLSTIIGGENLYSCTVCGFMFRFPHADNTSLAAAYHEGETNWSQSAVPRRDWNVARELISKYTNCGKILDIGCFDGGFLNSLHGNFDKYGIEANYSAARKAQFEGIHVISNNFDDLSKIGDHFDLITAIDVIEHTNNPMKLLSSISNHLIKGGLCIISTGNTSASSWRFMGSSYWYCANPEHVSFISPDWCVYSAEKCSLSVIDQRFFSYRDGDIIRKFSDAAKNIAYKFAPSIFSFARRLGYGKRDSSIHKEIANYPPTWLTAKDHFAVVYKKL